MIYEMPLPSLGADMEEARFLNWRVKVGDHIQKGQVVAEIETAKAAVEIEAFHVGKIVQLLAQPEEIVPVGKTIAKLEIEGAEAETSSVPQSMAPSAAAAQVLDARKTAVAMKSPLDRAAAAFSTDTSTTQASRLRISPVAKRFAEENAIDLKSQAVLSLTGSGTEGAIELKDLQTLRGASFAAKRPAAGGFQNIRQAIAKAMSRSKETIPHYYLKLEANVDRLLNLLDRKNAELLPTDRLMLPAALAYIVAQSLKKNSDFNGYYVDDRFQKSNSINLGLAISLKSGGVVVPALLDSEAMSFTQFNAAFKELIQRTREAKLKNRELTEGTFTITNLGDLGADEVQGIIFPPQVALVGIGRLREVPVVKDEQVSRQSVMTFTLSADHRVTDGISGSKFLRDISRHLNNPESFLK